MIGGSPDGLNIKAGVGSTYLSGLRDAVIAEGADWVSRTTVTRTVAWRSRPTGPWSTATSSLALLAISLRDGAGWPATPSSRP